MCGIGAIVADVGAVADQLQMDRMLGRMAHRGPDDSGTAAVDGVLLGHRRLSIIDLTAGGHQPMQHEHLTIVLNGEIYNYRELRAELKSLGRCFISDSDTEVALQSWAQWGESALKRFVGMWAFVLHDSRNHIVLACRDPFGIKPLYSTRVGSARYFASEIAPLLEVSSSARADLVSLADYLLFGMTDHTSRTFFEGLEQVAAGTFWRLDLASGRFMRVRYYDLINRSRSRETTAEEFASELRGSVAIHMRSDVPVGTCLSGGLDSSVVAALASAAHVAAGSSERFHAVTARSESPDTDEAGFAEAVARHCNLNWHVAAPVYADFQSEIEDCLRLQGEPVGGPSVFMQYQVFKTAKAHGLKVMLDGQGGDEALLGYDRYFAAYLIHLVHTGQYRQALREYGKLARNTALGVGRLLQYIVYYSVPALQRWRMSSRRSILAPEIVRAAGPTLDAMVGTFLDVEGMQKTELMRFSLPHLLRYEDRNSMAWSIEARVPFVTPQVMESAIAVPFGQKLRDGFSKHPLRLLASQLVPPQIAWRKRKLGFEAPTTIWLREHAPEIERRLFESAIVSAVTARPIAAAKLAPAMRWRLYNLAVWERHFRVTLR